jgi:hypothetical protein
VVTLGVVGVVSFGRAAIGGFWDLLINAPFLTALLGAVRSELAAVEDPRERRHFARAVVVVTVVRRTLTAWTWLLAGCVAIALALGLLALSRARVGDGVGDYTLFVPPLVFFAVGAVAAKRLGSFSRGLVVAATVAALSAVAMLPVAATEAAHLYSEAGVSLLDGETVQVHSTSAAVLDTLHRCSSCSTSSAGSPAPCSAPGWELAPNRSTRGPRTEEWDQPDPAQTRRAGEPASVADVQRVPQRPVQLRPRHLVEPADRLGVERRLADGDLAVAVDDARPGQPLLGPDLDSERMPRTVRVIGAQVTVASTAMAAAATRAGSWGCAR